MMPVNRHSNISTPVNDLKPVNTSPSERVNTVNDLNPANISPSERVNAVDMSDTVKILPTNQANAINTSDLRIDSIMTNVSSGEILFIDGSPSKPLSNESLHLSSAFPSGPLDLQPGTSHLGSQPVYPPDASPSSTCTQGSDPLQQHRTSRPPRTAGVTGSDDAPHQRATSATEADDLHYESLHTDPAPAAPPRDDPPDGPGF